eukprot:1145401-Pelagomonas_calceolata.AAC.14
MQGVTFYVMFCACVVATEARLNGKQGRRRHKLVHFSGLENGGAWQCVFVKRDRTGRIMAHTDKL